MNLKNSCHLRRLGSPGARERLHAARRAIPTISVEILVTDRRNTRIKKLATLAATVAAGLAVPGLANDPATTTPIKHVIVIFQENVSFDH
jgi:phospholipase C